MIFQIQLDHLLRMNKNQWSNFILFLNDNFVTIYSYVIIHFNWNERKTGGGGGGIILAIKFELPKIQIFNVVYFKWNINPCCVIPKNTSSRYQNQSEIIECNTLRKLLNIITYDLYILCIILPSILHRSKQHKLSNKNISHERSNETSINPTTPKPEPWLKPKLSQDIPPPPRDTIHPWQTPMESGRKCRTLRDRRSWKDLLLLCWTGQRECGRLAVRNKWPATQQGTP